MTQPLSALLAGAAAVALAATASAQTEIDFSANLTPFSLGGLGCGQTFFPEDASGYAGQTTLDLTEISFWSGNLGGAGDPTTYLAIYDGNPDTAGLVGTSTNSIDTAAAVPNYTEWTWTFANLTLDADTEYWAVISNSPNDVNPTNEIGRSLQEYDHLGTPNDAYRGTSVIANRAPHQTSIDLRFRVTFDDGGGSLNLFCDPANANSSGNAVTLAGSGFSGPGVVHLEASGGPASQFGYFLVSSTFNDPGTPVSQGLICVGSPQGRYNGVSGLSSLGQFDAGGVFQNIAGTSTVGSGFDVPPNLPSPPGGVIVPGSTYHFQLWYRDGANSNFSNGVTVSFP